MILYFTKIISFYLKNCLHDELSEEHKEPDYEKAELDLLRDALKKTHEERFFTMTKLIKQGIMMKNAKVGHKPLSATNKKSFERST